MNKCCEKCEKHIFGYPDYGYWCRDNGCECHSKPQEESGGSAEPSLAGQGEWEKSFEEKFGGITAHEAGQNWLPMFEEIRRFIRTLLAHEREEARVEGHNFGFRNGEEIGAQAILRELEGYADAMRAEKMFGENVQWDAGWKAALSDILTWIRGRKEGL